MTRIPPRHRERTEDELVAAGMEVFHKVHARQLYYERDTLRKALEQIIWMADAEEPLSVKAASIARDALEAAGLKPVREGKLDQWTELRARLAETLYDALAETEKDDEPGESVYYQGVASALTDAIMPLIQQFREKVGQR